MSDARAPARAGAPLTHLLYLHGFRSSPRSTKAKKFGAWVAAHRPDLVWWCPQLAASPAQALSEVLAGVAAWPAERMAVIGSSLGGFYATAVAERRGCRAVLLNPAVDPARDLAAAVGSDDRVAQRRAIRIPRRIRRRTARDRTAADADPAGALSRRHRHGR